MTIWQRIGIENEIYMKQKRIVTKERNSQRCILVTRSCWFLSIFVDFFVFIVLMMIIIIDFLRLNLYFAYVIWKKYIIPNQFLARERDRECANKKTKIERDIRTDEMTTRLSIAIIFIGGISMLGKHEQPTTTTSFFLVHVTSARLGVIWWWRHDWKRL